MLKNETKTVNLNEDEIIYLKGIVQNQLEKLYFHKRESSRLSQPLNKEFKIVTKLEEKLSV